MLILVLHEWKHKSTWLALCAEVVSGTETKGLLSPLAWLTQECEKAHSCTQTSACCQKYFCGPSLAYFPKKKKTFHCLGPLQETWAGLEVETVKML